MDDTSILSPLMVNVTAVRNSDVSLRNASSEANVAGHRQSVPSETASPRQREHESSSSQSARQAEESASATQGGAAASFTAVNYDTSRGMEQVFYRLHTRFVSTVTGVFAPPVLRGLEFVTLLCAFLSLGLVLYLHLHFISPFGSPGCLIPALQNTSDPQFKETNIIDIRVEMVWPQIAEKFGSEIATQLEAGWPPSNLQLSWMADSSAVTSRCSSGLNSSRDGLSECTLWQSTLLSVVSAIRGILAHFPSLTNTPASSESCETLTDGQCVANSTISEESALYNASFLPPGLMEKLLSSPSYLYSLEKGFLLLKDSSRDEHNISLRKVVIPRDYVCIGQGFVRFLLDNVIGYDTIVVNNLIVMYGGRGYLYNAVSKELVNVNYASEFNASTGGLDNYFVFKLGVLITTLFLFFTITTLISFTLRETQERMLKFTFLLQHHVRNRLPYGPLILTHVVESLVFVPILVGILFFLFEFFNDQLLAFMVLSVVWLCELFSVISVRTRTSVRFFPRAFFYYFSLFHIYFFSFPFGFSYLILITTVLFLLHSMMFFWNRFEVPALQAGRITLDCPREAGLQGYRPVVAEHNATVANAEWDNSIPATAGAATRTTFTFQATGPNAVNLRQSLSDQALSALAFTHAAADAATRATVSRDAPQHNAQPSSPRTLPSSVRLLQLLRFRAG